MATQLALINRDVNATKRTEAAITEIHRRAGLPPVALSGLMGRQDLQPLDVGHSEVTAALAEAVLRLSDHLEEVRAALAAGKK